MRTLIVTLLLLAGPAYAGQVCGPVFGCDGEPFFGSIIQRPNQDARDGSLLRGGGLLPPVIRDETTCVTVACNRLIESCLTKTVCR